MEKLSVEIVLLIIDCLVDDYVSLAPYAAISRPWQAIVESRTFAHIKAETEELYLFRTAFSRTGAKYRRLEALRLLEVNIGMHVWGLSDRRTTIKQQTYQADATALLRELRNWGQDPGSPYAFKVKILSWARMHREVPPFTGSPSASALASVDPVPFVKTLHVQIRSGLSKYVLATARRFSNIQSLSIEYRDEHYKWHRRRRMDRVELAEGLLGLRTLPCLEELSLSFERRNPQNQHFVDQNLEDDDDDEDDDEDGDDDDEDDDWDIASGASQSSNRPGMLHDGEYDSSDEGQYKANPGLLEAARQRDEPSNLFRERPDPATFNPLALSFAAAVAAPGSLPRLRTAKLAMSHGSLSGLLRVAMVCGEAGREADPWWSDWCGQPRGAIPPVRCWRFVVDGGNTFWHPSREILDEWRKWLGDDGLVFDVVFGRKVTVITD